MKAEIEKRKVADSIKEYPGIFTSMFSRWMEQVLRICSSFVQFVVVLQKHLESVEFWDS